MSVLIKGMAMPKSCNECPFGKEKQLDVGIICTLLDGTTFDTTSRPTSMCPLIELPPHGRLIDADAVYKVIKEDEEWVANNFGDEEQTLLLGYQCAYGRSRRMIRHAPTIIEAESEYDG